MAYKIVNTIGLILVLLGTGLLGFSIPRSGQTITAPNLTKARWAIGLIVVGTISQIIATWIP